MIEVSKFTTTGDYQIKQAFLTSLSPSRGGTSISNDVTRMSQNAGLSFAKSWVILDEMQKMGHMTFIDIASKLGDDRLYTITHEGEYFLESGGYSSAQNKARLKAVWDFVKVAAVIANAVTALMLSYFSYKAADYNNEIQRRQELKSDIKEFTQMLIDVTKFIEEERLAKKNTSKPNSLTDVNGVKVNK